MALPVGFVKRKTPMSNPRDTQPHNTQPRITNNYRSPQRPPEFAWIGLLQAPLTRALLIVAALILGVLLLGSWASAAAGSLLLVLLASVLALALNPLVVWLELRRIPRGMGAVLVVLAVVGVLVGVIGLIAPML